MEQLFQKRFEENKKLERGEILVFENLKNKRIYNPSSPLKMKNNIYIFARVEDILSDNSQSMLFKETQNKYFLVKNAPIFNLEDPFVIQFKNEIILGGVYVERNALGKISFFRTIFYRGKDIFNLDPDKPFAQGPLMMKDIRLVELENKRIGVFTRPTGGKFLRGRICYLEINSLDELKDLDYTKAREIELLLLPNEWVGTNAAFVLKDNKIGVLGHWAFEDENNNLHYLAITFIFDPKNFTVSQKKIIAKRDDFPLGQFKKESLKDVVFPGGFLKLDKNCIFLYCGLSDAEIGRIKIENPFEN